jgi:hypothetical protein
MAIISIPSSIGGVAIPGGLVNIAKGPLAVLFGNSKSLAIYQYPRDLNSATRGHYIQFSVNEVKEAQFSAEFEKLSPEATGQEILGTLTRNVVTAAKETASNINVKLDSNRKEETKAVIALYMPESMAFTYNAVYDDTSLVSIGKDVAGALAGVKSSGKKSIDKLKNVVGGVGNAFSKGVTIAGSNAAKLALQTQGLAINPQKQLLFQGIGFREYQLVFTFTPYSKQEADQVQEIIKAFKKYSAPTITDSAGGMFFKVPASFNLKFMFNGKENTKISKVAESVLTTVDVNYSPNTWASTSDGSPVQIMLTLNFKEIEILDSKKMEEGY